MPVPSNESQPWSRAVVHYDEISLKGGNRPFFEKVLRGNIRSALRGLPVAEVRRVPGRILVAFSEPVPHETAYERLSCVPGVANFGPLLRFPLDPAALPERIAARMAGVEATTFGVRARRAVKSIAQTSDELGAAIGAAVVARTGLRVDLKNPDVWVRVEVLAREILVSFARYPGAGGLPIGVAGKVVVMLSGGIDSPVAAYRVMRRGARAVFVHFHSHPFTDRASQEKAIELAERLSRFQGRSRLYLVPLGEIQRRVVADAPAPLRVLLYRRFMFRISDRIASSEDAKALVTGECLGQVASQTLENMAASSSVVRTVVLRPLIGFDKREIVAEAERISTYDLSIQPHSDCCSFLMPRNPATASSRAELDRAEDGWPVDEWVRDAVERSERLVVEPRHVSAPIREIAVAR